jgi:asparagine synthase (glutamine-hydrolysing)
MCGIAGIISLDNRTVDNNLLLKMARALSHRGPDDEQFIVFDTEKARFDLFRRGSTSGLAGNIGFAHRRLSIIDLSPDAAQPMSDEKGLVWIIHNGEVFNYLELREELTKIGYVFRTHSDTEVILKAYMEWGQECLNRFNGMWAFVIYDLRENVIFGARDRFGIKPFFYHTSEKYFAFASEIKALLHLPWIRREPNLTAIKDYLYFSRVDTSEFSFFTGINSLKPGHYFHLKRGRFHFQKWWDISKNTHTSIQDEEEIFKRFRNHLLNSVKLRLRSDVPVGTCLSGGMDSASIVSLANPILKEGFQRTFSIIQPGHPKDESPYIDRLINHFNVDAQKKAVTGKDLLNDLQKVICSQDEPFTSTSMYAQWKVFELAKNHSVTVTLDGQGADETLAGYPYFKMVYWSELFRKARLSSFVKEVYQDSTTLPKFGLNLLMTFSGFLPHRKTIALAKIKDPQYFTYWINKKHFRNIPLPHSRLKNIFQSHLNQRLHEVFSHDGLPALLRYADRNSMAHSLESRMPFMDHRLVSFLFSLPPEFKIRNGLSKFIMRKALKDDVPDYILNRHDKVPFLTSEAQWFRNDMRDLIMNVIHSDSFKARPYFKAHKVQRLYKKHLEGKIDASRPLWRILNLELWLREYMDGDRPSQEI